MAACFPERVALALPLSRIAWAFIHPLMAKHGNQHSVGGGRSQSSDKEECAISTIFAPWR